MFNFYLFNNSYRKANVKDIEENLQCLNDLVIDERSVIDKFLKHDSIWYVNTLDGLFSEVVFDKFVDKQFSCIVAPKMFQSIDSIENEIITFEEFDNLFKVYNAFYGIHFNDVDFNRCISNKVTYSEYRKKYLWELTSESLWERKDILFSKIILCNTVENDLKRIGDTYLEQIVDKLSILDNYLMQFWKSGEFIYKDVNDKTSLNISPESKKTMEQKKYYNQRVFKLPDGRNECFELHIKTGNLRFYFFPENYKIYIGYIGKHLDTDRFN